MYIFILKGNVLSLMNSHWCCTMQTLGWLCPQESQRYNVVKWLIAWTWTHHADISSYSTAEDPNKQCRRQARWADKAEQTKALTVSQICRSYLHNLFSTDSFMIIQLLCGCLKRGHALKPPDSSFLSALHLTTVPTRNTFAEYWTWSAKATEDWIGKRQI